MNTISIREQLRQYINSANEESLQKLVVFVNEYLDTGNVLGNEELTEAQKNELDKRIDLKAKGEALYSSWDDVKNRIMQRKLNSKAG
ncbi:MAG: hypothetical protein ACK5Z2_11185 [Bacteroidota bacterium]|jgi:hypothetical protein